MDCRELVAGTSLFLPVLAPGALFSFGDGHAAQGDGEVSGTAIECMMRRVELRFVVRRDMKLAGPRARTPEAWVTMGFAENLDAAAARAMSSMLDVMSELYALDRVHALALASAVVRLRVTQVVNGVRGAHAVLRDDAVECG
jgi:acetamidase/formamidase